MRSLAPLLVVLLLTGPVQAQPSLTRLLPDRAGAGKTIFVTGSGFGTDRSRIRVLFGEVEGKVVAAREESLAVQVPWEAPASTQVVVEVDGVSSEALPFECTPSVRLTVDRNPVPVGETARGTFRVYHSEKPVTLRFRNGTPQVVSFEGGDEQTVRTSGGEDNRYDFAILGKSGPRPYDVEYEWSFSAADFVKWTLPWGQVDMTGKPSSSKSAE